MSSIIRATTTSGLQVAPDNSGSLQLQTNGTTTAVTIDTSQNVGIGTTSPAYKLDVTGVARLGNGVTQIAPSATDIASTSHTILSGTGGNGLFFGQYPAGQSYAQWIQSSFTNPTTATYDLILQPLGGAVSINNNLLFNSGYGSAATAYGCRAWVNFNGTGTPAIVESGNISSITDNGAGDYTLNFTNAMSDANYTAVFGQVAGSTSANNYVQGIRITGSSVTGTATTKTTSALRIVGRSAAGSSVDCEQNNVAIFR